MSLQMTRLAGKKNQKMPLNMLCATNLTWATIIQIVTIVHVSWPTWDDEDGVGAVNEQSDGEGDDDGGNNDEEKRERSSGRQHRD